MNGKKHKIETKDLYYLEVVHDHWIDMESRQMWIHGVDVSGIDYEGDEPGVEYLMATKTIKNLHLLLKDSKTEPITIHMHTCGGDVCEGLAIYDAISMMPFHVTIISYTHARSMSSVIFQAADERLLLPHSYFMMHYGNTHVGGDAKTVYSTINFYKKQDAMIDDIYITKMKKAKKFRGKSQEYIQRFIKRQMDEKGDVFLFAEEAIEWGLADGIISNF